MTPNKKKLESGELAIIYIVYMVICVFGFTLVGAILLYLFTDCWPLSSVGVAPCVVHVAPGFVGFLPIALGVVIGGLVAHRIGK